MSADGSNVGPYPIGKEIGNGAWYFYRAVNGPVAQVAPERFPTEHRDQPKGQPDQGPTGARRITGYLARFHRRNGELSVASTNVANDPYKQSMWNVDPELEAQSARIVAATDWRLLNK